MSQGLIFDIQHFAIHDGPGIRTAVFLKGCPLECVWCHNPEGQDFKAEILYSPEKCIACRSCEAACASGFHHFLGDEHRYARADCTGCGSCSAECYARALELCGQWMTAADVLEAVLSDQDFYRHSGGGLTLSGGEPMMQFDFSREVLQAARQAGLHTCLETSGCGPAGHFREIAALVDLCLFDIKETDAERHRQFTGRANQEILNNLFVLDEAGAALVLRCPLIPGLNDRADHFRAIGQLANRLRHVVEVQVMPYHPLGRSKSQRLGKESQLGEILRPEEEQVRGWVAAIQEGCEVPVRKG